MPSWDDAQYLRFYDERTRAAGELLARVPLTAPAKIVDLGCGPGNSTALLQQRYPSAHITGVDNSQDMLQRARVDYPALEFAFGDVATFGAPSPVDLLFSNAVLHWIPEHERVFPRLMSGLAPGGVLAIQMPVNLAEPSHQLMHDLVGWSARFADFKPRSEILPLSDYYDIFAPSASRIDIWQTTYQHVMSSAEDIVAWVKGSGLRPYLDALQPEEQETYLVDYTRAVSAAYPVRSDGKRLFAFPRLFIVVTR